MTDFSKTLNALGLDSARKPGFDPYSDCSDVAEVSTAVQQQRSDVVSEPPAKSVPLADRQPFEESAQIDTRQIDTSDSSISSRHSAVTGELFSETTAIDCPLINGGFEAGLSHWITLEGTEQLSKIDTYIGLAALVLSTMDSGTAQKVCAMPGKIYQLTGYGRSTSPKYSSFGMTFFNANGSLLARSDVGIIRSTQWKDYFAVAIAPRNTAYVQVWTYQGFDHGLTLIDGLSLRQIPPDHVPPRQKSSFSLINAPIQSNHGLYFCG